MRFLADMFVVRLTQFGLRGPDAYPTPLPKPFASLARLCTNCWTLASWASSCRCSTHTPMTRHNARRCEKGLGADALSVAPHLDARRYVCKHTSTLNCPSACAHHR